jgi:hypothetical protein
MFQKQAFFTYLFLNKITLKFYKMQKINKSDLRRLVRESLENYGWGPGEEQEEFLNAEDLFGDESIEALKDIEAEYGEEELAPFGSTEDPSSFVKGVTGKLDEEELDSRFKNPKYSSDYDSAEKEWDEEFDAHHNRDYSWIDHVDSHISVQDMSDQREMLDDLGMEDYELDDVVYEINDLEEELYDRFKDPKYSSDYDEAEEEMEHQEFINYSDPYPERYEPSQDEKDMVYDLTGSEGIEEGVDDYHAIKDSEGNPIKRNITVTVPETGKLARVMSFAVEDNTMKLKVVYLGDDWGSEDILEPSQVIVKDKQNKELEEIKYGVSKSVKNRSENRKEYYRLNESEKINEMTDQERYEDVVFLQGSEADEALEILKQEGPEAAIKHLSQWHDFGNGMGREELPHGSSDDTFEKDGYHLSWNAPIGYIGLVYDHKHEGEQIEESGRGLGSGVKRSGDRNVKMRDDHAHAPMTNLSESIKSFISKEGIKVKDVKKFINEESDRLAKEYMSRKEMDELKEKYGFISEGDIKESELFFESLMINEGIKDLFKKKVSDEQAAYNKEHGLPKNWNGTKEGYHEYITKKKHNSGSN